MATLEATPIPLEGPGYSGRKSKFYTPGEYLDLKNVVISSQGTLKKRLPAQGLKYGFVNPVLNKFIGQWGSDAVYSVYDTGGNNSNLFRRIESSRSVSSINITNWAALKTALNTASAYPGGYTHSYIIEGIFQYNNSNYYIVLHAAFLEAAPDATYKTNYYIVKGNYNYLHPERNDSITFVTTGLVPFITLTDIVTSFTGSSQSSAFLPVTSFYMHKDRLVVAVRDTVYLSKPTDPQLFSVVDDGAFIKFPGKYLKQTIAFGDAIYAIFDSSVSYITYNQGPNTDLQVRSISEIVGGEDACIYGGVIYLLRSNSIYAINGMNISKILDIDFPLYEGPKPLKTGRAFMSTAVFPSYKIIGFDDGLYVLSRNHSFLANNCHIAQTVFKGVSSNLFRIDLNNGHISRFTYAALDTGPTEALLKDLFIVTNQSIQTEQSSFYILGSNLDNTSSISCTHSPISYFNYSNIGDIRYDDVQEHGLDVFSVAAGNDFHVRSIPVNIHISGLAPDNYKYLKKKFHSIMIEANFPSWVSGLPGGVDGGWEAELELNVLVGANLDDSGVIHSSFPSYDPPTFTHIINVPLFIAPNNSVLGYRFSALQRAKAIDIQIKTRDSVLNGPFKSITDLQDVDEGKLQLLLSIMEIVDITTLWSPTKRKPTGSYLSTDQS